MILVGLVDSVEITVSPAHNREHLSIFVFFVCVGTAYLVLKILFWMNLFETGVFLLVRVLIHMVHLVFLVLSLIDLSGTLELANRCFRSIELISNLLRYKQ